MALRESIGSTFLYTIIFLFILIIIALLSATINYYKAFKVNKAILGYISQYSGYNESSKKAIDNYLYSIGYMLNNDQVICKGNKAKGELLTKKLNKNHYYCIYYHDNDNGVKDSNKKNGDGHFVYYAYGVTTYLYIDLPIVGSFKVPVYTKGERIYNFSDSVKQDMEKW